MTGGLDVLETIGKKTYDVIAEGDHGLKNTLRSTGNKTNLSQVNMEILLSSNCRVPLMSGFIGAHFIG